MSSDKEKYLKGRGAQINTNNRYLKQQLSQDYWEAIDEELEQNSKTTFIPTFPKSIINRVDSPDIGLGYSLNPYQGCEHGCIYCYARNTHEYWGFSAGLDFERKIIVKQNITDLLEKEFSNKNWKPLPIMLSGNTDCYQPAERKFRLTRSVIETCLKFKNPVSIVTKNVLILRDMDILSELAQNNLVHVTISITGVQESTRQMLEPRTSTYKKRFEALQTLNNRGIPTGILAAPIIPGLNLHEVPEILKIAAQSGARSAGYTLVRLNGAVGELFKDWLFKNHPDKSDKVWNQIAECHGGSVADHRFGTRMRGEGKLSEMVKTMFEIYSKKYFADKGQVILRTDLFKSDAGSGQLSLF